MFHEQDYAGSAELILIEDGDQDCSDLAIGPYVRHMRFDGTTGAKLNAGVAAARGSICVRFDDDDWQSPERIRRQVDQLRMSDKSVVACSSGLYYTEGDGVAYEYSGDIWLCSGFTHAFHRDWALAHPYPDESVCEDLEFVREAHAHGKLSTISGVAWVVARNHPGNTCPRDFSDPQQRAFLLSSDNWREVPVSRIAAIVGRQINQKEYYPCPASTPVSALS